MNHHQWLVTRERKTGYKKGRETMERERKSMDNRKRERLIKGQKGERGYIKRETQLRVVPPPDRQKRAVVISYQSN